MKGFVKMIHNFYGFINHDSISPLPLILYDMGFELRQNEDYYFDNHNRENYDGYIIQYTLSGYGIYETDEKKYTLNNNTGFITCIPNNCIYYLPTDNNNQWEYLYVHFGGSLAKQFYEEIVAVTGNVFSLPLNNPAIQLLINEYELLGHGRQYKRFEAGAFIYNMLTTLLREISSPASADGMISKAVNWIKSNYASDISLSELCEMLQITQSHFSRSFRREIGISPIEYLSNVRLEHAMQLLTTTNLSINEIAVLSGFSNGNYFAKAFKRKLGFTPSDYKRNH